MSACRTPAGMVDGMVALAGVSGGGEDPAHFRWHAERMVARIFAAAVTEGIIVRRVWCVEHAGVGACYVFTNDPERPDGTDWFAAFAAQVRDSDDEEGCPWGRG